MTHLSNKVKYIEKSFEDKPSFIVKIDDVEYISNGCVFVENIQDEIDKLVEEYDCKDYLDELLSSEWVDFSIITNARYMFGYCKSLKSFDSDMSGVIDAYSMFSNCISLEKFTSDMSNMTNASFMFYNCTSLKK